MNLRWKLDRVRAMSAAEITYRTGLEFRTWVERAGLRRMRVPVPRGRAGRPWVHPLPSGFDISRYTRAADRVLAGTFTIFALHDAELGFPPNWNTDPLTGVAAPMIYGRSIDYRDTRLVGNIKYLWEPNRHLELVALAQAWHLTREPRYLDGFRTLLESWFEQCPYPSGPNWTSSLELGLRLVNWSVAWQLLRGDESPLFESAEGDSFRQRWLASVFQHCQFIAGRLSRHSSANNHLLGELLGLYVAATTWPLWPTSEDWRRSAHRNFERELLMQVSTDGVNREQAVWYHHEVADMLLIALLVGRANGDELSVDVARTLERMLEFIAALMDCAGNVPAWGDSDDAVMIRFDPDRKASVFRSLLATGAVLFERAEFAAKAVNFDDKSRWMLGDQAQHRFQTLVPNAHDVTPRREFACGGYFILGEQFESPEEVRIVADAGPLGYLAIAAHGHADALALTLSAGGKEMLVDSGTYAYHTDRPWRDYFRGTSAHNTVRVDGVDQSVAAGNFLWLRHARAVSERFESSRELDQFVGSHDGYRRLGDPVLHRREILYRKGVAELEVVDRLTCAGRHAVEVFWHFAPECSAVIDSGAATVTNDATRMRITWSPGLSAGLRRGESAPPLGWVSRRFDVREPTWVLVLSCAIDGDWECRTQFKVEIRGPASGGDSSPSP